MMKRNSTVKAI